MQTLMNARMLSPMNAIRTPCVQMWMDSTSAVALKDMKEMADSALVRSRFCHQNFFSYAGGDSTQCNV